MTNSTLSPWVIAETNVAQLRLRTTQYDAVAEMLGDMLELKRDGGVTRAALIVGDTGSGKTAAVQRFVAKHPREEQETRTYVPVVYVEVSEAPTLIEFCEAILRAYSPDSQVYQKGRLSDLRQRVRRLITACGTLMLVIDEAQHLIDRGGKKTHEKMTDFIKILMNDEVAVGGNYAGVSVALVGLPRVERFLEINKQLSRRVVFGRVSMDGYHVKDEQNAKLFLTYMMDFVKKSGADMDITAYGALLKSGRTLETLYYATDGRMSYMSVLSSMAIASAIKNGRKQITQEDLQSAFLRVTRFQPKPEDNPFNDAFVPRRLRSAGEPFGEAA